MLVQVDLWFVCFLCVCVCLSTDQVLDNLLYLGLSLLHLLRWPLQTDALLAVRKLNVHLHAQTETNLIKHTSR